MHRLPVNRLAAALAAVIMLGSWVPAPARAAAFPPLNNPSTTRQFPGKFIWADLFTNQPSTAADFYCGLFGWTAAPIEQNNRSYIVLNNGDRPVAGIVQRTAGTGNRPGVWIGYISVTDAKATLAGVEPAGGHERAPARAFPQRGIQAIFTDCEGSPVGILQSSSGDPSEDEPSPGDWNWFELFSQRPKATADFYRSVLGYEENADIRPGKTDHWVLSSGARARAGIAPLPASPDSKPGWMGCVRVSDIDAASAKAVSLGGEILVAPRPAALGSRFAVVADPTGGAVGLVQYEDNANPANRP